MIGHDAVRAELERHLPQVVLLRGPVSVGKRTLADHLIRHHGVAEHDVRRVDKLTADVARDLRSFVCVAPMGRRKVVIIDLDDASETALNVLLKTLEEPPPWAAFLLTAAHPTLDTIASRAMTYRMGLLSEEQLFLVLTGRLGMEQKAAERAARLGRGQVDAAQAVGETDANRARVLGALKAVKDSDPDLLDRVLSSWTEVDHELLGTWAAEAMCKRWRVFSADESFGLADTAIPRKLLSSLRLGARAKLSAVVALAPLVSR
jgi:replication-associated recombination protein RarA